MSKVGHNKGQNARDLVDAGEIKMIGKNTWKNYTKNIFMNQVKTWVWPVTQSQTFWRVKSSGP